MHEAIAKLAVDAGWRLQALLRTRRFHSTSSLIRLYKAQILSFLEAATPAIVHAAPSQLDRIDRIQRRFLREIGLSEYEALSKYKLAPLETRRDIAMLGLLQKVALGLAHPELAKLFPKKQISSGRLFTSVFAMRHDKQLCERFIRCSDYIRRSAFGFVFIYNALPQAAVNLSVRQLQGCLQSVILRRAASETNDWQSFLRQGASFRSIRDFQAFFL